MKELFHLWKQKKQLKSWIREKVIRQVKAIINEVQPNRWFALLHRVSELPQS